MDTPRVRARISALACVLTVLTFAAPVAGGERLVCDAFIGTRLPNPAALGAVHEPYRSALDDRRGLFVFFQAEAGIRDLPVTGVQTCALPISRRVGRLAGHHIQVAVEPAGDAGELVEPLVGGPGGPGRRDGGGCGCGPVLAGVPDEVEIGRAACRGRG